MPHMNALPLFIFAKNGYHTSQSTLPCWHFYPSGRPATQPGGLKW